MRFYQHLRAPNDTNGNPRRLFVVYEVVYSSALLVEVVDEGYEGKPERLRDLPYLLTHDIGVSEYRALRKRGVQLQEEKRRAETKV